MSEYKMAEALRGFLRLVESEPDPRHGDYRMRFSVRAADYFAAKEALRDYDEFTAQARAAGL